MGSFDNFLMELNNQQIEIVKEKIPEKIFKPLGKDIKAFISLGLGSPTKKILSVIPPEDLLASFDMNDISKTMLSFFNFVTNTSDLEELSKRLKPNFVGINILDALEHANDLYKYDIGQHIQVEQEVDSKTISLNLSLFCLNYWINEESVAKMMFSIVFKPIESDMIINNTITEKERKQISPPRGYFETFKSMRKECEYIARKTYTLGMLPESLIFADVKEYLDWDNVGKTLSFILRDETINSNEIIYRLSVAISAWYEENVIRKIYDDLNEN